MERFNFDGLLVHGWLLFLAIAVDWRFAIAGLVLIILAILAKS